MRILSQNRIFRASKSLIFRQRLSSPSALLDVVVQIDRQIHCNTIVVKETVQEFCDCKSDYTETLYSTLCRLIPKSTNYWFWPVALKTLRFNNGSVLDI